MKDDAVKKLKILGVSTGYNGFNYLVWILKSYDSYNVEKMKMVCITKLLAEKFEVSEKAVLHNLTLLLERSWSGENSLALKRVFGFCEYMPTLKEFISTLIVASEFIA